MVEALPEGRKRWHNKDTETHTAPVLGGPLSFQPMSQKAELGISGVEGANSISSVLAHRASGQFSRRLLRWLLLPAPSTHGRVI